MWKKLAQLNEQSQLDMMRYNNPWDRETVEDYQSMCMPLIVRSLEIANDEELATFSLPEDRVRVFVYAPLPEELRTLGNDFAGQSGYVLYTVDVFLPAPTTVKAETD